MLKQIEKIMVIINDTEKIDTLLKEAIALSGNSNILLEILFVHESPLFSLPDYFRKNNTDTLHKEHVKEKIEDVLSTVGYEGDHVVFVEESDTVDRAAALEKENPDTFCISFFHEKITAKLASKLTSPLLILKNDFKKYTHLLLPVNLDENNIDLIERLETFFPDAKIELVFEETFFMENYIDESDFALLPLDSTPSFDIDVEIARGEKQKFEALKEETGLPGDFIDDMDESLTDYIASHPSDLLVLHSENDNFLSDETISLSLISSVQKDLLILR